MASLASLHSLCQRPCHGFFTPFSVISRYEKQSLLCCRSSRNQEREQEETPHLDLLAFVVSNRNRSCIEKDDQSKAKRRQVVFQLAFTAFFSPPVVSTVFAETGVPGDFRIYTDEANKFKITIPQDWQVGAGEPNGFKSITAFYPSDSSNSNVSVVITGLGPDFTRMESFGKVEAFADTLVSGLDRSWQRPPGVAAKLIDCKAANGFYYIEYTLQKPGEIRKHLFSAIGMASNGWYNRLYTVTGQFEEDESEKYGSKIEEAVASFRFI